MSRGRLARGFSALAINRLSMTLVQLLMVPVLAHGWGVETYGAWTMLATVPVFLALSDFGISNAAWARMTRFVAIDQWADARTTFHTSLLWSLALAGVIAALSALAYFGLPRGWLPTASRLDDGEARQVLILLVFYGLGVIIHRLVASAIRAGGHLPLAVHLRTGIYIAEYGLLAASALAGFDPVAGTAAMLGARTAGIAVTIACHLRVLPRLRPGLRQATLAEGRILLRPSIAASLLGFGGAFFLQGNVVLLGMLAGPASVPAFVAVRTLSRLGIQLTKMVSTPATQEFGAAMARGEVLRGGRLFGLVLWVSAALAVGTALCLVVLGDLTVRVWTHGALDPSWGVLVFMAVSSLGGILWNPLSEFLLAVNRHNELTWGFLGMSVIGLAVLWLLGRQYGATAAAISFAVMDVATLALLSLIAGRSWLAQAEFRKGVAESFAELRNPLAMMKSLRRR